MKKIFLIFISIVVYSNCYSHKIPEEISIKLKEAVDKAYIPEGRSSYKVGTVLETEDGELITGSNVKLSCGLTICAERVALYKALTNKKNLKIKNVYVNNHKSKGCSVCGVCLQALAPFVTKETKFFIPNNEGNREEKKFKELLPYPFIGTHKY